MEHKLPSVPYVCESATVGMSETEIKAKIKHWRQRANDHAKYRDVAYVIYCMAYVREYKRILELQKHEQLIEETF
jgi:hypothetical protein